VGRGIEPHQPLVQDPGVLEVQRPLTRRNGLGEQDVRTFVRPVERDLRDVDLRAVAVGQPTVLDLKVHRVQHDLPDRLPHRAPGRPGAAEGPRSQVGLDRELVAGGYDGSRQAVRRLASARPAHSTGASQEAYCSISPLVAAKNVPWISFVIGPRVPSPTTRSSTSRTGVTSAAVPVKKASSALYRSVRTRF